MRNENIGDKSSGFWYRFDYRASGLSLGKGDWLIMDLSHLPLTHSLFYTLFGCNRGKRKEKKWQEGRENKGKRFSNVCLETRRDGEKKERRITMIFFVWFTEGKEMRRKDIYFLLLCSHEFESNAFKNLNKKVNSLTWKVKMFTLIFFLLLFSLQIRPNWADGKG